MSAEIRCREGARFAGNRGLERYRDSRGGADAWRQLAGALRALGDRPRGQEARATQGELDTLALLLAPLAPRED